MLANSQLSGEWGLLGKSQPCDLFLFNTLKHQGKTQACLSVFASQTYNRVSIFCRANVFWRFPLQSPASWWQTVIPFLEKCFIRKKASSSNRNGRGHQWPLCGLWGIKVRHTYSSIHHSEPIWLPGTLGFWSFACCFASCHLDEKAGEMDGQEQTGLTMGLRKVWATHGQVREWEKSWSLHRSLLLEKEGFSPLNCEIPG